MAQEDPMSQDGPTSAPGTHYTARRVPRWSNRAPKRPERAPRQPKRTPRDPQDCPTRGQGSYKMAQIVKMKGVMYDALPLPPPPRPPPRR
eukprot:3282921-Pyramimonas_sp.AAC.1